MLDGLTFERCETPDLWDTFVDRSLQGTAFCYWDILDLYDASVDRWFLCRNGVPKLAVPILHRDGAALAAQPFGYYQGPMLSDDVCAMRSIRRHGWTMSLLEAAAQFLSDRYSRVFFTTHWSLNDLRGLDWLNIHTPEKGRFRFFPRYTALVNPANYKDRDAYLAAIRKDRRQDLKYAAAAGYALESTADPGPIRELYRSTLADKGIQITESEARILDGMATLAQRQPERGETLVMRDPGGSIVAAQLLLHDPRNAHGVALGGTQEANRNGAKTALSLAWLDIARERGTLQDFNGANSPDLADFKHSLASDPAPFFRCDWHAGTEA